MLRRHTEKFVEICDTLENHYRNMQDMEFTIEKGKLFMLQTRNGKRTAAAALQIACDMVDEGKVSIDEALMMVEPKQLDSLLHPMFDASELKAAKPIATALPASPGAACGQIVFSAEEAIAEAAKGQEGHPGAFGDFSGGYRGHACRTGHPDRARRHDEPCGRRGSRHGTHAAYPDAVISICTMMKDISAVNGKRVSPR